MCLPNFLCFLWILAVLPSYAPASEWKPIAAPAGYYPTTPVTCISDCNVGLNFPRHEDVGESGTETQVKTVWPSQPSLAQNYQIQTIEAISQGADSQPNSQNLDLEIYKPAEIAFFPQVESDKSAHSPVLSYQEVFKKTPGNFYGFKTYIPAQKYIKTFYHGHPDVLKSKLTEEVKFIAPVGHTQNIGNDVKFIIKQPHLEPQLKKYQQLSIKTYDDHCSLYKASLRQDLHYQYLQYKVNMPDLKEFTICLWFKLHTHNHDHSLFSYEAKPRHQDIYMWVSNLNEPGLINMKVTGQTIFRLNYPVKLYKWYHTCQSWNGNTGEWQVWVNNHRIARGFHNLLVGQKIPGKGVAITGQKYKSLGKNPHEAQYYFSGSKGFEGEVTMLQMYKVALTAGKAYNDHRHHHSHYTTTTPEPPEEPTEEAPATTDHPFLENGQLKKHINIIELAEAFHAKEQADAYEKQKHLSGAYLTGHASPFLVHGNSINIVSLPNHAVYKRDHRKDGGSPEEASGSEPEDDEAKAKRESTRSSNLTKKVKTGKASSLAPSQNVKFPTERNAFKQRYSGGGNATDESSSENSSAELLDQEEEKQDEEGEPKSRRGRSHRHSVRHVIFVSPKVHVPEYKVGRGELRKRSGGEPKPSPKKPVESQGTPTKRFLAYVDDYPNAGAPDPGHLTSSYSSFDFLPHIDANFDAHNDHDGHHDDYDNPLTSSETETDTGPQLEVAEGEVRRISHICSGCHLDPFRKVAVISWRSTPKKFFSGALLVKARSECEHF